MVLNCCEIYVQNFQVQIYVKKLNCQLLYSFSDRIMLESLKVCHIPISAPVHSLNYLEKMDLQKKICLQTSFSILICKCLLCEHCII